MFTFSEHAIRSEWVQLSDVVQVGYFNQAQVETKIQKKNATNLNEAKN